MNEPTTSLKVGESALTMEHWREAMAHLRYLNDEVWKRFQFFFGVNVANFLAIVFVMKLQWFDPRSSVLIAILALLGFCVTFSARYVLKRNRIYYLQMLLRKTLLENELGAYDTKLGGSETDLAFPWRVAPENIETMKQNPTKWVEDSIQSKGTIARHLFSIYDVLMAVYVAVILIAVLGSAW